MEPFLGEIRIFPWDWPPVGFALCDGAVLPINQNQALFRLISNVYGGDGKTTFALPDLRGRVPLPMVRPNLIGAKGGAEQVTLTADQVPRHTHTTNTVTARGDAAGPKDKLFAQVGPFNGGMITQIYANPPFPQGKAPVTLASTTINPAGGGIAHPNMQPYLVLNFCIATEGVFPPPG